VRKIILLGIISSCIATDEKGTSKFNDNKINPKKVTSINFSPFGGETKNESFFLTGIFFFNKQASNFSKYKF